MILQALVRHYEQLAAKGRLEAPGWQSVRVSFALRLSESGELRAIEDLREEVKSGKKTVLTPRTMQVPEQVKRSSGVASNFLCDNTAYMLGVDSRGKPDRALACFEACAQKHRAVLGGVAHPVAAAILRFFETWNPAQAAGHPLVAPLLGELATANLIFQVGLTSAQDVPDIRAAWQRAYEAPAKGAQVMRCLVTGESAEVARLHPSIKGVQDAQAMGASLVSFNAPAFESYAHDGGQGLNAPVGKYAAFAYGAALNRLLSDRDHRMHLGDTTIVFWAEDAEEAYADLFSAMLGNDQRVQDRDLLGVMRALAEGRSVSWEDVPLQPENRFYVLGLAPNSARLSVRFFLQDSFGAFSARMTAHHQRMEIVRPKNDPWETIPVFAMLRETVNPNASSKEASPHLAGDVVTAILTGGMYPETLYQQVQLRIRAEHEVTRGKAAIIKAYLLRNTPEGKNRENVLEVAQVKLNEETRYAPYVLGRMFAVLEGIQEAANPGINTTIRDRYFNSACCTPAVVFPVLIRLAQAHLKKLDGGLAVHMNRQLQELMGMLDEAYPDRLGLSDQGVFQLGYYHQRQKRYEKKEDRDNG